MSKKNRKINKRSNAKQSRKVTKSAAQTITLSKNQAFQLVLQHFKSGNFHQAEQLCSQLLKIDPKHAEAIHLLGVILVQQQNKKDEAINYFQKALTLNPQNAEVHKNLGFAFYESGRMEEAISSCREALELNPDYVEIYNIIGMALRKIGELDEAINYFQKSLNFNPENAEIHKNLGFAFYESGKLEEAIRSCRKALALNPDNVEIYNILGLGLRKTGKLDEAIASYKKALVLYPDNVDALNNLGIVFYESNKFDEAISSYKKVLAINPDYAVTYNNLGSALKELGKFDEAIANYKKALAINPDYAESYNNLGLVLKDLGKSDEAIANYKKALELRPDNAVVYNNLGIALRDSGKFDESIKSYNKALEINPNYEAAHNNLGNLLKDLGKPDEAITSYKKALEINPDNAVVYNNIGIVFKELGEKDKSIANFKKALAIKPDYSVVYRHLALMGKNIVPEDFIQTMEGLFVGGNLSDEDRMDLGFALGKVYEDRKEYVRSFDYILEANRLKRKSYKYSITPVRAFFDRIKLTFSASFFSSHHTSGNQDATPIFILGMPRSGTTLIEQILSSHPLVFGADELMILSKLTKKICSEKTKKKFPECISHLDNENYKKIGQDYIDEVRKYSGDAKHITDKLPHNFLRIGLIKIILPNAKVINCIRNPMDNCYSIFKNVFTGTHKYGYNLNELGQYYRCYLDLMNHWKNVIPGFVYDIKYEEIISDQHNQTRKLLEFCNLPWDEACLDFHKTKRIVKTASNVQVRKPIYTDSVELWKRYEAQLEPLRKAIYG